MMGHDPETPVSTYQTPAEKCPAEDAVLTMFQQLKPATFGSLPRCQAARDVDQPNNGGNHS